MDDMRAIAASATVLWIASVHLWFPWFDRRAAAFRHAWVHFSGGIAVGYVTLYLLPKMTDLTLAVMRQSGPQWEFLQYRVYLAFLAGLLVYLAIERTGFRAARPTLLPWVRGAGLGAYNLLMGYFVFGFPREGFLPYVLAGGVLSIHTLGIDHQVRGFHRRVFDDYLRWVMAFAMILGGAIAYVDTMPAVLVYTGSAFLGGAMLVNVMVAELPQSVRGSMKPFLAGVFVFVCAMAAIRSAPLV